MKNKIRIMLAATVNYPASAVTCCPSGWCPDQKCYTPTSSGTLVCSP